MSNQLVLSAVRASLTTAMALALLLGGLAFAHAELITSEPAANTTVTAELTGVTLKFTEPLETKFSIFKAYRLDAAVDMSADNAWQRINGLAGALVSEVLTSRTDGDAEARVDTGLKAADARSAEVVIDLKQDLQPGVYVVMWRVLSIDTHTTQGFTVFEYAPSAE